MSNINKNMQKHTNKEFEELQNIHLKFAVDKVNYHFWKKMIFSIMGGMFAGLGYIAFNFLNGGQFNELTGDFEKTIENGFFFGSLLFPVGIMMCIFLGGNLFTSNVLVIMGVFAKKIKIKLFFFDLIITLIGNIVGGILMALLAFGSSIYWTYDSSAGFQINDIGWGITYIADKKVDTQWWSNILSGILCNLLVAGSIYAYVKVDDRRLGALLVYFFIVVFAICGFQHVVANTFVFTEASLLSIMAKGDLNAFTKLQMGESVYINMIPTVIGNIMGGVFISGVYMYVESERAKKIFNKRVKIIVAEDDISLSNDK